MNAPMSAADQRGHDWMQRWVELGCNLTVDGTGNIVLVPPGSCSSPAVAAEITGMRSSIQSDSLLAHAVGRALLNYWRWEDAQNAALPKSASGVPLTRRRT